MPPRTVAPQLRFAHRPQQAEETDNTHRIHPEQAAL